MSRSYFGIVGIAVLSGALQAQLQFTDVTATAGVSGTTTFGNKFTGGGGCGDFDRDGDQDLFMPMGPTGVDRLFLNDGTGTFTDAAAAWGCAATHMGTGMAVGDYDNDGWQDIYLLSLGTSSPSPGKHRLYQNLGGTGFAQVATAAGVAFTSVVAGDGYGTCFGDYDMDGDLDLVATGWLTIAVGNRIFRNNGDGTFSNVTSAATGTALNGVRGYTPQLFDMDGDLDPELLYASDFHTSRYLVNNGDGTFTNATATSGTALDSNGMGAVVADFNGDLVPDWYVTSIWEDGGCSSGNMLYLNQGANAFAETSVSAGVNDGGWGWGTVGTDLDLDGDTDIVENNGFPDPLLPGAEPGCITHDPVSQWIGEPAYLWLNDGDGSSFTESHVACGLDFAFDGRGLLNTDIDGDGDQDIALFANSGALKLYRNDLAGPDHHWLRVFLDSLQKPGIVPDGLGSKVYATSGAVTQMAPVMDKSSFISACEQSALFGLGASTSADQLRVEWPDGTTTWLDALAADQTLTITHHGWKMLGGGLAGTGGVQPVFTGKGDLTGGELITLELSAAAPSAPLVIFLGLFQVNTPFKGGILVPAPNIVLPGFFTSPSGGLLLPAPWPTGLPAQLVLTMQVWLKDAGAIHGVSGSNALQITTP